MHMAPSPGLGASQHSGLRAVRLLMRQLRDPRSRAPMSKAKWAWPFTTKLINHHTSFFSHSVEQNTTLPWFNRWKHIPYVLMGRESNNFHPYFKTSNSNHQQWDMPYLRVRGFYEAFKTADNMLNEKPTLLKVQYKNRSLEVIWYGCSH